MAADGIATPPDLTDLLPPPTVHLATIPPVFAKSNPPPQLLAQGAEGVLFKSTFLQPDRPCAIKYRPVKTWRHPTLDQRLTRHRILSEARILVKCRREGISVPAVLALDWEGTDVPAQPGRKGGGWMVVEWIEGLTVRKSLDGWLKGVKLPDPSQERVWPAREKELVDLMGKIGKEIGKMHRHGNVHGDLTTSNLMLRHKVDSSAIKDAGQGSDHSRPPLDGDLVLIDFGLAVQSSQDEDRAVDLYVLERAFGSTHPNTDDLFEAVLKAYGQSFKGAKVVLKRLEEVRMRGRKRSMIG